MSSKITLETIDSDGAVQEAAERAGFSTRSDFFKKSIYAGGSLVAGGVLMGGMPAIASAKPSAKNDVKILQFALTLEYLEAAFYKQAVASGALTDPATFALATTISKHETAHVTFLRKALGSHKIKSPTFDFKDTVTDQKKFTDTAFVLENTGVSAYLGQAGNIKNPAYLGAAATILTIEARHAGAIAQLTGQSVSPNGSFDRPKSKSAILKAVTGTGFITG
ncbi:ferritin-like domain-containing protein [Paraconexibacter antarcticus]|uniref:Ferritin-like domain-containing protein n=1 Tax=Paraconexibacter antarcticus TaxID=2949664 RepID=A0ABY5DYQ3_9ACTN|nr:ferritin-like domain-containing protein [Paraconexibacter antarcticus]UTI66670.1 ferritin-like domain-containing protein [Paraconexibacter antarcticus]